MNASTMLDYANYSMNNMDILSTNNIGSEQNLFNFINENKIKYEWLDWLGLIRNDWERNGNVLDVNNFHIC